PSSRSAPGRMIAGTRVADRRNARIGGAVRFRVDGRVRDRVTAGIGHLPRRFVGWAARAGVGAVGRGGVWLLHGRLPVGVWTSLRAKLPAYGELALPLPRLHLQAGRLVP